jgi:class 3 adenylate cyclase
VHGRGEDERRSTLARVLTDRRVVVRAVVTSVVVGSILTLARVVRDEPLRWVDAAVACGVPFIVSIVTSWATIKRTRTDITLLEREIQAINRFPDRNPNPVLRFTLEGTLTYANAVSEPIVSALEITVGDRLPPERLDQLVRWADQGGERIEVADGMWTFALTPVRVEDLDVLNVYGTDITAEKVVDRFPVRNPNPVMRVSDTGALIFANEASRGIVRSLAIEVGDPMPPGLLADLRATLDGELAGELEFRGGDRTYRLRPVQIPEFGFLNVYGTDITAEKWVTKFPDQNPNPVLRATREGELVYANAASAPVTKGLGLAIGDRFPDELFGRLLAIADAGRAETVEVQGEGRIVAILPIWVPDFGFVNLYGTDVTAARELERAHRENERLLLNILPAPIADRLRSGEATIADGFEETTVLFADVVGFTELSSRLPPRHIVEILNEVFSAFDELVETHRLEKIKTIGDAYMVVGGLELDAVDHALRVAELGLAMIDAVAFLRNRFEEEVRLRVGMHTGPAVAGVIGIKKFIYDVWGDTVNLASRLETTGVPGRIQVATSTFERLQDRFAFEPRGEVELKGKGLVSTYLLTGPLADGPAPGGGDTLNRRVPPPR